MKRTMTFSVLCACLLLVVVSQQFSQIRNSQFRGERLKNNRADDHNLADIPGGKPNKKDGLRLAIGSQEGLKAKLEALYPDRKVEVHKDEKADVGSTGSGRVVERKRDLIIIDTTPCSDEKDVLRFHKEYKESEISDIDCGDGRKFTRSKVRQL